MATTTILPPVPPLLAARGIVLRAEDDGDAAFLRRLFAAGRAPELRAFGWPDAAMALFLDQQFDLQTRHYRGHYPGAAWGIVVQGEAPAGRLCLLRTAKELRIIDIAMLRDYQGQGIGTALVKAVLDQGACAHIPVSLHVEQGNFGAQRLYERLGFKKAGAVGAHFRMDWSPPACDPAHPV